MRLWTCIPDGMTYVALSASGELQGFGCRRPCIQPESHQVGPLYADSGDVAEALLQMLCADVTGKDVTINVW